MPEIPSRVHVEPAPYALPQGVPALQADPAQTRRGFLFSAIGGVALGIGLAAVWSRDGTAAMPAPAGNSDPRLGWLIRTFEAPDDVLVEQHELLLALSSQFRDLPQVRAGIRRLSAAALRGDTRRHQQLSLRLLDYLALEPGAEELRGDLAAMLGRSAAEAR